MCKSNINLLAKVYVQDKVKYTYFALEINDLHVPKTSVNKIDSKVFNQSSSEEKQKAVDDYLSRNESSLQLRIDEDQIRETEPLQMKQLDVLNQIEILEKHDQTVMGSDLNFDFSQNAKPNCRKSENKTTCTHATV